MRFAGVKVPGLVEIVGGSGLGEERKAGLAKEAEDVEDVEDVGVCIAVVT